MARFQAIRDECFTEGQAAYQEYLQLAADHALYEEEKAKIDQQAEIRLDEEEEMLGRTQKVPYESQVQMYANAEFGLTSCCDCRWLPHRKSRFRFERTRR